MFAPVTKASLFPYEVKFRSSLNGKMWNEINSVMFRK